MDGQLFTMSPELIINLVKTTGTCIHYTELHPFTDRIQQNF